VVESLFEAALIQAKAAVTAKTPGHFEKPHICCAGLFHGLRSAEAVAMAGQPGFFDVEERYAALSAAGDPLERLAAVVDFEIFRPALEAALALGSQPRWPPTL